MGGLSVREILRVLQHGDHRQPESVHKRAALPLGRAPQTARPDTMLLARHAAAWPRSLSGTLLVPHAPFPLEWFPTLVDTSTWLSSLLRLSLMTFSSYCTIPVFLALATRSLKAKAVGCCRVERKKEPP